MSEDPVMVHAWIPTDVWWDFKKLAKKQRRTQAILFRGALDTLLEKYKNAKSYAPGVTLRDPKLTSFVARIEREQFLRLKALAVKSRISQSEFVREAVADFLKVEA